MVESRYDRQVLAFGQKGQKGIEAARVGVVGVGGIGSHIVQSLSYLGVRSFTLVDPDRADITSLNRLVGASPEDVEAGTLKVDIARRQIMQLDPTRTVTVVPNSLRTRTALEAISACSVIFGCVDNDGARLILSELASAYAAVLFDCATEIFKDGERISDIGGRVVMARAHEYCLLCAEQMDIEQAKWDLASPSSRETRKAHGYGLGEEVPSPAVISLNGVVANLAVTEFLMWATRVREPVQHLTYHAWRGNVNVRTVNSREDCFICRGLAGIRDAANIFRYALD
jgi:molybdopterin/thiamine biosynthesis adenylyltransferase